MIHRLNIQPLHTKKLKTTFCIKLRYPLTEITIEILYKSLTFSCGKCFRIVDKICIYYIILSSVQIAGLNSFDFIFSSMYAFGNNFCYIVTCASSLRMRGPSEDGTGPVHEAKVPFRSGDIAFVRPTTVAMATKASRAATSMAWKRFHNKLLKMFLFTKSLF